MTAPFKKCSCGREHTRREWEALPLVGHQDDGVDVLELRNCQCRSTMVIVLDDRHLAVTPAVRAVMLRAHENPLGYVMVRSDRDGGAAMAALADMVARAWFEVVATYEDRGRGAVGMLARLLERGRDAAKICSGSLS